MKRTLFIFFFLMVALLAKSQTIKDIDSLNAYSYKIRTTNRDSSSILADSAIKLSTKRNYQKGLGWGKLNKGIYYYYEFKLDSALIYLIDAENILKNSHSDLALGYVYRLKSLTYQRLFNYKKAKEYLELAGEKFQLTGNAFEIALNLGNLGVCEGRQNNYPEALEYFTKALKKKMEIDSTSVSSEYSNIAIVYNRMGEYDKAISFIKKAIALSEREDDFKGLQKSYNTFGGIYNVSGRNYDSAILLYNKSLYYAKLNKNKYAQTIALDNIAESYKAKKEYNLSKKYLRESNRIYNELYAEDNFFSLKTLSDIFLLQNRTDSALYYGKQAFTLAKKVNDKVYQYEILEQLSSTFETLNKYDSALYYYKLAKSTNDSIYNKDKANLFSNLQIQLETQDKETEIQKLKLVQYQSKVRNTTNLVVAATLLLVVVIFFWLYKNRLNKKHKELEERKRNLELQLEQSKKKLSNHTLSMIHRNNVFEEIEMELKSIRSKGNADPGLVKIQSAINLNKSLENDWVNFSNFFGEIHQTFFDALKKQNPELSDYELRLCALIKIKLTNKEIATILNIEHKSVKMAKYRLKKKLDLEESAALSEFISTIE